MERNKQTKVLAAIVGLGVAAVCVDRFVLGTGVTGPEPAAAQGVPEAAGGSAGGKSASEKPERPPSLAVRLASLSAAAPAAGESAFDSNAFEAPPGWFRPPAENVVRTEKPAPAAPALALKLTSVMPPFAYINGERVAEGQEITLKDKELGKEAPAHRLRLIELRSRQAVVELDGQRLTISLPDPSRRAETEKDGK